MLRKLNTCYTAVALAIEARAGWWLRLWPTRNPGCALLTTGPDRIHENTARVHRLGFHKPRKLAGDRCETGRQCDHRHPCVSRSGASDGRPSL
ncbi:hypothetical protein [Sinorhizobium arboris]|uniref:hypothetical protein n=1 Tax=Sinorhizobium arboris TaxID=76745 RepID=UPI003AFFD5D1